MNKFIVLELISKLSKIIEQIESRKESDLVLTELEARYFAKIQSGLTNKPLMVLSVSDLKKFRRIAAYYPGGFIEEYSEPMRKISNKNR